MKKLVIMLLAVWVFLGVLCGATAETQEAKDITATCTFTCCGKKTNAKKLKDRHYSTYYILPKGKSLEVTAKG